jgi:hypothetical protein
MSAPDTAPTLTRPPRGVVLVRKVAGTPVRYQLSVFPERPRMEFASETVAWQLARSFAATDGVEVWFTADGESYTPAATRPPASRRG